MLLYSVWGDGDETIQHWQVICETLKLYEQKEIHFSTHPREY
jgi:hypothetical protein